MSFLGSWVIDSGAIDHIIHSSQKFSTYNPCPSNKKIATTDGSLTTMASQGEVHLNKYMYLSFPPILFPFIDLPKNWIVTWFFIPLIVFLRNKVQGRWLDMLGKMMDFIILSYHLIKIGLRTRYLYHSFLKSHPQQKIKFGFIIIVLDICCLVFLKLCFLYFSKELM